MHAGQDDMAEKDWQAIGFGPKSEADWPNQLDFSPRGLGALNKNNNAETMKNNGGHPSKKSEDEKVNQQLKVYVTAEEEIVIKHKAEILDMSFSAFARRLLLEEEIDVNPKELKKIRYELNKIGVNLNQLTKKANQKDQLPNHQRLEAMHKKIIEVLRQL